jgi:hypothetical protein
MQITIKGGIPKKLRIERLKSGVPLVVLALESGLAASTLSEAERGIRRLRPEQEEKRRAALGRLSVA